MEGCVNAGSGILKAVAKEIPSKPILLALGCTLCAALALSAAVAGASPDSSLVILAAFPAAGLLAFALTEANRLARRLDVFSPLVAFPVLYIAWFVLGSLDIIDVPATFDFGLFEPIPGYVIGYAALGLAAYLAGSVLGRPKPIGNYTGRTPGFTWAGDRFAAVSVGLGLLMAVSYLYIIAGIGEIPALSPDAGEVRLRIAQYGPAEAVMLTCAWTLIPTLMMYVWGRSPRWRVRLLCFASVGVSSVLLVSLGGRRLIIDPILTTLVARHYGKRRFAIRRLALVCVALFCSLSFFGYVRDTSLGGAKYAEDQLGIPGSVLPFVYAYLYVRYPVATFRDITTIVPNKIPYQRGALSFGPLATVLPGHHEQSDMFFKNILGSDFNGAGQPATLLGPLYADAGLPGIVVGLFFTGIFMARAYAWMLAKPTVIRVLLYAWLTKTLLFSLFVSLFPDITAVWIPAFWMMLDLSLRTPRVDGTSLTITEGPSHAH